MNELTEMLEENSNDILYLDNFFRSTTLCRDLAERSLCCTGTVQQSRTESYLLCNSSTMIQDRGAFEVFGDGKATLCQWNDNRPVCLVSNQESIDPITSV